METKTGVTLNLTMTTPAEEPWEFGEDTDDQASNADAIEVGHLAVAPGQS